MLALTSKQVKQLLRDGVFKNKVCLAFVLILLFVFFANLNGCVHEIASPFPFGVC